jgi:hypothetical protein
MSESARGLVREISRLLERLRVWSPASWDVPTAAGSTRAARAAALAVELARLGREAGSGAPPGAVPPLVAAHALADQITVLADDLLRALRAADLDPARRADLTAAAMAEIASARAELVGFGFGFGPAIGRGGGRDGAVAAAGGGDQRDPGPTDLSQH